jgi:hypothetical protein
MRPRTAIGLAFTLLSSAAQAAAQERTAVLIMVPGDTELSDNLTDVAISALASLRRQEFVGSRELRARASKDLAICVADQECIFELCGLAGAGRAVVGSIDRHDDRAVLTVSVGDPKQAKHDAVVSRETSFSVDDLILAVQNIMPTVVQRLEAMVPGTPETTPSRVTLVQNAVPQTAANLVAEPTARHERLRRSAAYTSAALAVVAFSAAAVAGSLARATPVGAMRAEAQRDLRQREAYATLTNYLLIGGTLLATTAVFTFVW